MTVALTVSFKLISFHSVARWLQLVLDKSTSSNQLQRSILSCGWWGLMT